MTPGTNTIPSPEAAVAVSAKPDGHVHRSAPAAMRAFYPDVVAAISCSIVALLGAIISTGARPSNLSLPWHLQDLLPYYSAAKGMMENGWWTPNPQLGYPFPQDSSSFPTPDFVSMVALKVLTLITSNPFASVNLYFLLGFPASAFATYVLLRSARASIIVSTILATSFALIPWHFERLQHLFLTNYAFTVVGLTLIGLIARGILDRDWHTASTKTVFGLSIVAAVIVGLGGTYNAAFTTMLGILVLGAQFLGARRIRDSLRSLLVLLIVPLSLGCTLVAIALTSQSTVTSSLPRFTRESLLYGGDLYSLFRVSGDGLGSTLLPKSLRELQPLITTALSEGDAGLNLVAVSAVILSFVLLTLTVVSSGGRYRRGRNLIRQVNPWLLAFLLSLFMFASGGFGVLFASFLSPSIRAWGRMSVGVAALALVVFGIALTVWLVSRKLRILCLVAIGVLAAVTVLDPILAPIRIDFAAARATQANLQPYVSDAEATLPAGCPVLELPIGLFPEYAPPGREGYYDDLLPYLYSTDLRWSYGGYQYTDEGQWAKKNLDKPPAEQVALAKKAGFCALQVDMLGFPAGDEASIRTTYTKLLGEPISVSKNKRWFMFSLNGS